MDNDFPAPPVPNPDYKIMTSVMLHVIPDNTRQFFYWLILTISVLAIIGNILAIRSIIERKTKFLQKLCFLTLALTDILSVLLYSTCVLEMLSNQLIVWDLGEFLCYFFPSAEVFSTIASALILVVIAMDRYRNCKQTFNTMMWNPTPTRCVVSLTILLLLCAGIAFPMYTYFNYIFIWVLMVPYTAEQAVYELKSYCYGTKYKLTAYLLTLDVAIFAPLLFMFTWFYYQIAVLIWKHRKPVTSTNYNNKNKGSEESISNSTKTTDVSSNEKVKHTVKPKKMNNIQFQKKIRTFRIVLALMVSFILCRFPYWCYYTIRLVSVRNDATSWNIHFAFIALNLFNSVLNPLLYTFLNPTITTLKIIREFFWKICCYCFANDEFEDFERNNQCPRDQVNSRCGTVTARPNLGKIHFEEKNERVQKY